MLVKQKFSLLAIFILAVLMISLVACSGQQSNSTTASTSKEPSKMEHLSFQ
ncbi:hypothetical protein J7E71_06360 [Mesobacillus foraminis]|uniref:hypothetical protein n=1 Tax=Mesobacillus foraminis TaxID=279826 RepID=UPI001BE5127E|nr:hypothetical protein [Mesobacillus foraminis]MBT2755582.1 hypothetical protein [Mesobacillus foraminis]